MVNKAYKMHVPLFNKNLEGQALPLQPAILAARGSGGGQCCTDQVTAQGSWLQGPSHCRVCRINPIFRPALWLSSWPGEVGKAVQCEHELTSLPLYHQSLTIMTKCIKEHMLLYSLLQISREKKTPADFKRLQI